MHIHIDNIYFTIADDCITCNHSLATLLEYNKLSLDVATYMYSMHTRLFNVSINNKIVYVHVHAVM